MKETDHLVEATIAEHWRAILVALKYDLRDPHLQATPERVARYLQSWHTNQDDPPKLTCFPNEPRADEMVVVSDLRFDSLCAHHGLPFFGTATIGYIPGDKLLGLSKFARVVDHFAHQFQVQERLGQEVADYLMKELQPRGLGVLMIGTHQCMVARGATKPGHKTTTNALRGLIFDHARARAEFLSLAGAGR